MFNLRKTMLRLAAMLVISALSVGIANANTAEEFYKGKTLRFMSTTGAGGTMDLYLLLVMKHIEKHLPESTETVLEQRPGAGGSVGTNYLFKAAPQDGTIIGMPVPSIVSNTFTRPETVRYKADEFHAIGRIVDLPRVYVARGDSGLKSLKDAAKGGEFTHGIMTVGTSLDQYMRIANLGLGTKFRPVAGYKGGGPVFLAMEQGEVQATTAEPANLLSNKMHLVKSGKVNVLAVGSMERMAALPDVPAIMELIPNDNPYRKMAEAVVSSGAIGLALIAPPGVPADRVAFLRKAFTATMNDPELIAEAKERNIPINGATGEWLGDLIKSSANVDADVKQWFVDLAKAK